MLQKFLVSLVIITLCTMPMVLFGCVDANNPAISKPIFDKKSAELNQKASEALQKNDYETAIKSLITANELSPENETLMQNLAIAYEKNKELSRARDAYLALGKLTKINVHKRREFDVRALDLNILLLQQNQDSTHEETLPIPLPQEALPKSIVEALLLEAKEVLPEAEYLKRVELLRSFYALEPMG